MPALPQTDCYPTQALANPNPANAPVCVACNADSYDGTTNCRLTRPGSCSSCNTVCVSIQNYCSIGVEAIKDHGTVGAYPDMTCEVVDEFIHRNWTAEWWNTYQDKLLTALAMGLTQNTGSYDVHARALRDPCHITHPRTTAPCGEWTVAEAPYVGHSLIRAIDYNDFAAMLAMLGQPIPTVEVDEVIRETHPQALHKGYDNAKFPANVCDTCNSSGQDHYNGCSCACSCSCSSPG